MSITTQGLIQEVAPYDPDKNCPSRVYVNGTRIPVAEVDVYLRKEGSLDITRYAEVSFASPFRGTAYSDVFNTFDGEDQTQPDTLRIEVSVSNGEDSTYTTIFHGIVTGVGSSVHENEKLYQARAQGLGLYLDKIPASKTFGGGATTTFTTTDVMKYVQEELGLKIPLNITVSNNFSEEFFSGAYNPIIDVFQDVALFFSDQRVITPKTFTANKHTLKDVVNWLRDKIGGRVWIQPTESGGQLVWTSNPTQTSGSHKAHYLDGNTKVVNNDALSELRPINTLVVNGQAKKSTLEVFEYELNRPISTYFKAKVRHKQLYQRAGNAELVGDTVRKSDAESKQEVINEAKSILKERIDEATAGSMQVLMDSFIQPFDTIEAKPTCDEVTTDEFDPLTYEIQRAHYIIHPNDSTLPHIDLTVGLKTDIDEDIEVVDTWNKET